MKQKSHKSHRLFWGALFGALTFGLWRGRQNRLLRQGPKAYYRPI